MRQCELVWKRWGGKRKGAGRKRKATRRRVPHVRRCVLGPANPVHITLRVVDGIGRLRCRRGFQVVRQVLQLVAERDGFRVVHASIQRDHLHLICEASDRRALSSGIRAFKISMARRLNRALSRSGSVWSDRYHEEILTSPTQVRNCIAYVANNWRKHGEDRDSTLKLDPYSTAAHFPGWAERATFRYRMVSSDDILPSTPPTSWLLREGWKRARPISVYERPGPGQGPN